MSVSKQMLIAVFTVGLLTGCSGGTLPHAESERSIDQWSFNLGITRAHIGVVSSGVKKLALGAPLPPEEIDALIGEAERMAAENGVRVCRETDFLVTDLFPTSLTEGKHLLMVCHESTYQEYMALKTYKQQRVEAGSYDATARVEVATRMGELLSYSEEKIASLLAEAEGSEAPRH